MKHPIHSLIFVLIHPIWCFAQKTDYSNDVHPQAIFKAFEQSLSPEDFETKLNDAANSCHNLDLNLDGEIDYLRVEDIHDQDLHVLAVRAVINERDEQDIIRIELEKTGAEDVTAELVGDETIFPDGLILEPGDEEAIKTKGPMPEFKTYPAIGGVNVWIWPAVRFIYAPVYRPYVSPWRWSHYPKVWKPRRVIAGPDFVLIKRKAYPGYRLVKTRRIVRSAAFYGPHRRVYHRHKGMAHPARKAAGHGQRRHGRK